MKWGSYRFPAVPIFLPQHRSFTINLSYQCGKLAPRKNLLSVAMSLPDIMRFLSDEMMQTCFDVMIRRLSSGDSDTMSLLTTACQADAQHPWEWSGRSCWPTWPWKVCHSVVCAWRVHVMMCDVFVEMGAGCHFEISRQFEHVNLILSCMPHVCMICGGSSPLPAIFLPCTW